MKPTPSSAPASMAGYLAQLQRALLRLAQANIDDIVGVETLDDVSVTGTDGSVLLEQDKLTLSENGDPITDRDPALWKTIGIWAKWLASRPVSNVRLVIATNRNLGGNIMPILAKGARSDWDNEEIVTKLIAEKRELLPPNTPVPDEKDAPAFALQKRINSIVSYGRELLLSVVSKIEVSQGDLGLNGALRKQTIGLLHLPEKVNSDLVYEGLCGWIEALLLDLWSSGAEGAVPRRAFDNQLDAVLRNIQRSSIQARASKLVAVSDADIAGEKLRQHRFAIHLSLVDTPDEDVDDEFSHYIRFNGEKMRLALGGEVPHGEWEARGERLKEYWKPKHKKCKEFPEDGLSPRKVGRKLFLEVCGHREPLNGYLMPEAYMTIGHYHRLADDDGVYWHPEYDPAVPDSLS